MNMMPGVICSISFFLLFVLVSNAQEVIEDPVSDFLGRIRSLEGDKLLKLEADINGDGRKEVFLSFSDWRNAKAGFSWLPYLPVEDGYITRDEVIDFRTDALFIGECEQFDGPALVTYWPSGGGKGSLIAFQIRDNKIEETVLHIKDGRYEKDGKVYERPFDDNEPPEIERIPLSELASLIKPVKKKEVKEVVEKKPEETQSPIDQEKPSSTFRTWMFGIIGAVLLAAIVFALAMSKRRSG